MAAALALHDNRLAEAERGLKASLKRDRFDARAMRMLAELAGRIGRLKDAESLLDLSGAARGRLGGAALDGFEAKGIVSARRTAP